MKKVLCLLILLFGVCVTSSAMDHEHDLNLDLFIKSLDAKCDSAVINTKKLSLKIMFLEAENSFLKQENASLRKELKSLLALIRSVEDDGEKRLSKISELENLLALKNS